jgi:hypothetical protein
VWCDIDRQVVGMSSYNSEERRIALDAICYLVHYKRDLFNYVLEPAGLPSAVYAQINQQHDTFGNSFTKREMAPLILDWGRSHAMNPSLEHCIVEIAAKWDRFELSADERLARDTVLRANGCLLVLADSTRAEETIMANDRHFDALRKEMETQSQLLLAQYDSLQHSSDRQGRGYSLQDLLDRLFRLHDIPVVKSFTRNDGGEQIDGAFSLDGWHYIIECRWRSEKVDIRQLDGLIGQIGRSGEQTLGIFLSINGWSENVVPLLKQNASKRTVLMDGYELRRVLADPLDLRTVVRTKFAALNLKASPFLSVRDF